MDRNAPRVTFSNGPAMTQGRPLVRVRVAGGHVPDNPDHCMGESRCLKEAAN
jgi:hypothetical protein